MKVDERGFEEAIEATLLAGGYLKSVPSHFDPVLGLDTAELFAFIGATQARDWERLLGRYGNEPDAFTRTLERIVEGWPALGNPFACLCAHGRPLGGDLLNAEPRFAASLHDL